MNFDTLYSLLPESRQLLDKQELARQYGELFFSDSDAPAICRYLKTRKVPKTAVRVVKVVSGGKTDYRLLFSRAMNYAEKKKIADQIREVCRGMASRTLLNWGTFDPPFRLVGDADGAPATRYYDYDGPIDDYDIDKETKKHWEDVIDGL